MTFLLSLDTCQACFDLQKADNDASGEFRFAPSAALSETTVIIGSGLAIGRDRRLLFTFIKSRVSSFKHAFKGWWHVIRTQKNAWIHAAATLAVGLVALWLEITAGEWAILILTVAVVWIAEFLNTALEIVVDLASPARHPLAKVGKDVGAASVLIAAGSAVLIGLLILGPPFWQKISLLWH